MPSSVINSDDGVISGTSGLKSTGGDDGVLLIQTNGTTAQTVDAGQRTKFPTTIGVGGATPSTSGSGITFPATQSASSNANTLDDYEEGTWTPAQGGGLSVIGAYASSGQYTKIGRNVTVLGVISGATSVACGENAQICTGLPFTANTDFQGSLVNGARNFSNNVAVFGGSTVQNSTAISATGSFAFTINYFV